jgi:glutathione S-transferase
MILIGQYDSPFVRRVAIAMTLYAMPFTHKPWSTFGDGDRIAPYNPLRRVPTLVLDDGRVLIESAYILDWLDEQKGEGALIARSGPERQQALYRIGLTMGFSDKVVALFYEKVLHQVTSDIWKSRLETQIGAVLDRLEGLRAQEKQRWFGGEALSHVDIALGCALRHARESHGDAIDWPRWPALIEHSEACEALPVFEAISQPFIGPSGQ